MHGSIQWCFMTKSTSPRVSKPNLQLLWSCTISTIFILALCCFFEPHWETNDDVAMSMVAHGYGIAAVSTPNLFFSNVLWGYFVRSIPRINGALGYSVATIGVLNFVGIVILLSLRRLGVGWLIALSVLTIVLTRPVLFPQFTINAGLVTVGAISCWYLYEQRGSMSALLIGCLLAWVGYLIRSMEFVLVLLVALPILP